LGSKINSFFQKEKHIDTLIFKYFLSLFVKMKVFKE